MMNPKRQKFLPLSLNRKFKHLLLINYTILLAVLALQFLPLILTFY